MIEKVQTGARKAAKEMENGVTRVTGGVELANQAGDAINSIQSANERVAAVVVEIGNALNEQSIAAQEIARGIEQIANTSEINSASMRQTTSSAERLHKLADELESSTARFRV